MKAWSMLWVLDILMASPAMAEYKKPQTPAELHSLFAIYFAAKDLNGLATLFHPDAVLVLKEGGEQAKGRAAITQALAGYMSGEVEMINHGASIHINGDTALVRSNWEIKGGKKGMALEVMTYQDGGWRYIIDNPNGF